MDPLLLAARQLNHCFSGIYMGRTWW